MATADETFQLRLWYHRQGVSAAERKIDYLLTFEEWLKIWIDSGKLHLRGTGAGRYCMGRFKDEGPYAVGNVQIEEWLENSRNGSKKRKVTELTREKLRRANLGKKMSLEVRQKLSAIRKGMPGHWKGKKRPPETLEKMRISRKAEYDADPAAWWAKHPALRQKGRIPWNKGIKTGASYIRTPEIKAKSSKAIKAGWRKRAIRAAIKAEFPA